MKEKYKILIVDDNAVNLALAGDVLEFEDFDVCRVLSAEQALETLKSFAPVLILMDLALPGMDGFELTRKLKSSAPTADIRIVALTASAMKGDRERIMAEGFDGYIAKPIDTRQFGKQVRHYLPEAND